MDLNSPVLHLINNYTAVRAGTSTSRGIFFSFFCFFRVRAARNKHVVPFDIKRSFFRFSGHSTQTDCGSCSADPKILHPAKHSRAMCEHTGGVLGYVVMVFQRDICREHSQSARRNDLMAEAANLLPAAAGPEWSKTINRNPIANLASDSATAGLLRVRVCVLWRPGASVGITQAER